MDLQRRLSEEVLKLRYRRYEGDGHVETGEHSSWGHNKYKGYRQEQVKEVQGAASRPAGLECHECGRRAGCHGGGDAKPCRAFLVDRGKEFSAVREQWREKALNRRVTRSGLNSAFSGCYVQNILEKEEEWK